MSLLLFHLLRDRVNVFPPSSLLGHRPGTTARPPPKTQRLLLPEQSPPDRVGFVHLFVRQHSSRAPGHLVQSHTIGLDSQLVALSSSSHVRIDSCPGTHRPKLQLFVRNPGAGYIAQIDSCCTGVQ